MRPLADIPFQMMKITSINILAQQLLATEAAGEGASGAATPALLRVSEKLQNRLTILMGNAGFRSLLTRALALAKAKSPELKAIGLNASGRLEWPNDLENTEPAAQAACVLIDELLGLLVLLIGEVLTLNLVRDAWPDLPFWQEQATEERL